MFRRLREISWIEYTMFENLKINDLIFKNQSKIPKSTPLKNSSRRTKSALYHHSSDILLATYTHLDEVHARRHLRRHARAVPGPFHQRQALLGYRLPGGIDPSDIRNTSQRKTRLRKTQINRLTATEGIGIDL